MSELRTAMERILANDAGVLAGLKNLSKRFSDLSDSLRKIGALDLTKSVSTCDRAIASIEEAMGSLKASMELSRTVIAHQSIRTMPLSTSEGVAVGKVIEVIQ